MNIQEAIGWQEAFKRTYKGVPKEVDTACDMAIIALEKQDSEKPYVNKYYYFCPCCGTRRSIKQKHQYCHECGKKLDWEESHG
mgnify:CR=1 FL=1